MAPSRGPFLEMREENPSFCVTLVSRLSYKGKNSMRNKEKKLKSRWSSQKKEVRLELIKLKFRKRRADWGGYHKKEEQKE